MNLLLIALALTMHAVPSQPAASCHTRISQSLTMRLDQPHSMELSLAKAQITDCVHQHSDELSKDELVSAFNVLDRIDGELARRSELAMEECAKHHAAH